MNFIREINDPFEGSEIKLQKIYRYLLRICMNSGLLGVIFMKILLKTTVFTDKNIRTLVLKNYFYYSYLRNMSLVQFQKAIEIKKKWANFIISNENFHSNDAITTAKNYLMFLENSCNKKSFPKNNFSNEKTEFYIYGPNSKSYPNPKFSNAYLVLTKLPNFDISIFPKKIIFLNNLSVLNYEKKYLINKTKDFEMVFVPQHRELFADNVCHISPYGDNLASPMGLGRIMMTLYKLKKSPIIFAEGFDLGLSKDAYSNKIQTFYKLKDSKSFEKNYLMSILIHDPIFNFLLLKHYSQNYKYIGSDLFLKILNMSLKEYLSELKNVRDFSSILKVF